MSASKIDIVKQLTADNDRLRTALKPFADCVEQIGKHEDDEEWAKFRLLIKDYRRAKKAFDLSIKQQAT